MKPLFTKFNRQAWILMALFFAFGVMTTSCSDDDDDNGSPSEQNDNNNNEAQEGSYDVSIEGGMEGNYSGGDALFQDTMFYQKDTSAVTLLALRDSSENFDMVIVIYEPDTDLVTEGNYDIVVQDNQNEFKRGSSVNLTIDGSHYSTVQSVGSIEITTKSETEVHGNFNGVQMMEASTEPSQITINGSFKAELAN